ncbi:MAG: DEAD/DEAH box helicase [Desulforhopalus sp.]
MKKLITFFGRRITQIAHVGRRRYGRFVGNVAGSGRSDGSENGTESSPPEPEKPSTAPDHNREGVAITKAGRQEGEGPAQDRPTRPQWSLDDFVVVPEKGKSRFHDYDIPLQVMRAIHDQGFQYCTPIQEKALENVLDGKDLVGKANTGTGKTAVFLIAIFSRLLNARRSGRGNVRALVLAPTRELVAQIAKDAHNLARYCNLSVREVYGGVDYQKQMDLLQNKRCDLLVATPGRLLDFMAKRVIDLGGCHILVLDEADRMLDMGFIPDVRKIIGRLPAKEDRQTMLFSATVPDDVKRLASQWCVKPQMVEAEPDQVAVETVQQVVYLTTAEEKYAVLYNLVKQNPDERIIVFANMKSEAKRLANRLQRNGIECVLLSGDVAQNKRMARLESFRKGSVKVLVATDVAGRGIHIEGITFVVNYTLPYEPENYVHRIGRTGRAGAIGKAVSFACEEGSFYLPEIEDFIGKKFECVMPEESLLASPPKGRQGNKRTAAGKNMSGKRRRPRSRKYRGPRSNPENRTAQSSQNNNKKG